MKQQKVLEQWQPRNPLSCWETLVMMSCGLEFAGFYCQVQQLWSNIQILTSDSVAVWLGLHCCWATASLHEAGVSLWPPTRLHLLESLLSVLHVCLLGMSCPAGTGCQVELLPVLLRTDSKPRIGSGQGLIHSTWISDMLGLGSFGEEHGI